MNTHKTLEAERAAPAGPRDGLSDYMRIDPRGPSRKIVAVDRNVVDNVVGPTLITKDCGHTGEYANHFTYKVGASLHCFACRDARDNTKPEYRDLDDGRDGAGFGCQSICP
jgi:hypothetical protein